MYLMGRDEYECDICGFREKWDAHDDHRGDMWECERCGKHFCTNCFKQACGEEDFRKMLSETDNVLCPECWQNQSQKKAFSINIRETLETQVAVEAENEEAALREVERRWKNGEYIVAAAAEQIAGAGLILWTCREGELLENALEACARWGLHFDAVSDSLPSWKKFYGNETRKVGATEYWDDKAYRVQNGKLMKEAAHEMA